MEGIFIKTIVTEENFTNIIVKATDRTGQHHGKAGKDVSIVPQ